MMCAVRISVNICGLIRLGNPSVRPKTRRQIAYLGRAIRTVSVLTRLMSECMNKELVVGIYPNPVYGQMRDLPLDAVTGGACRTNLMFRELWSTEHTRTVC